MMSRVDVPREITKEITHPHHSASLLALRNRLGVSQQRMAELLGLSSKTTISTLESGRGNFSNQTIRCMGYIEQLLDFGVNP